jgi:type I restriction enzyme M protein
MDASQYKDYVLTLLFVKYVSDKAKDDPDSLIRVPEGGSFDDLILLKGKAEIGDLVNKAIVKLAEKNDLVDVLRSADFDDKTKLGAGKELVDRLSNLIGIFEDLDFSGSRAEGDDLLGDAYEYLMRHFATESGKSKGQFYTPAEVSRVMASLLQIPADTPKSTTVYDPTCGSGSLLIKVADAAPNGLTIYGQENDVATWALAKMNMILHGNETNDIRQGNTLADPKLRTGDELWTFDYLVANPPFSHKTWKNGVTKDFKRFEGFDSPPDRNGDFAFLLHMVKSLKSTGTAAVIMPHGVLFRGNAEGNIRKSLVQRGLIKAVIGLPPNLFYGTGIPACILIIEKAGAADRKGIFMVDASRGYVKDGAKNRLRPRDMHQIVDGVVKGAEIKGFSRFVTNAEIESSKNQYNLNIPRYIDSSAPDDIQDLSAHIRGGVPDNDIEALSRYWEAFPSLRGTLFAPLRDGYSSFAVQKADIPTTVSTDVEYVTFLRDTGTIIAEWWTSHREQLEGINSSTFPNEMITSLSEDLLTLFRGRPLLDEYAVYEQLMSYWNDSMHDDVALVGGEGWPEAGLPRPARSWKDKNDKLKYEESHLQSGAGAKATRWVMDLLPPKYVVSRYFSAEQDALDALRVELATTLSAIDSLMNEHAVEDGLLWNAVTDDGKITLTSVRAAIREARVEGVDGEVEMLAQMGDFLSEDVRLKKAIKDGSSSLDDAVLAKYWELTPVDIQSLVIHEKWGKEIGALIVHEVVAMGESLVQRLRLLADRYELTVQALEAAERELEGKVRGHLAAMGVST